MRNPFVTVRVEGGLFPLEFLQRLVVGDKIPGLEPESYHLGKGERLGEEISRAWSRLQGAWVALREGLRQLPEDEPAVAMTRDRWLLPLCHELGYGRLPKAAAVQAAGESFAISHGYANVPIHLMGARVSLDRRQARVVGASRSSPHGLVQELLNRDDARVWGFVANATTLRLLRSNRSLARHSYVEFDLEAMFEGEHFSDFRLLWLLCHQSRVEGEKAEGYWVERWHRQACEEGVRQLDHLRDSVQQAIETLGQGFLKRRSNRRLLEALGSGELRADEYYRQLLRLAYRLIFLFVAEDRGALLDPSSSDEAQSRYRRFYATSRLRHLAMKRGGGSQVDLWRSLRLVMDGLAEGCSALGLPALGSWLWRQESLPELGNSDLANEQLLAAVRALCTVEERGQRLPVNWRNLGAEELGSVYESLLELHPVLNRQAGSFELRGSAGSERKTTGSYYTPTPLIECLLDSALEPVLEHAVRGKQREQAVRSLLGLRVCDPACGSGHFLVAAARRMARRLGTIRTGDLEPSPRETRAALRDVVGRCLYGVDVNPMAVELCKVSLWMEALEPGKPLSFLDSHILCGNSLLGTTPRLLADGVPAGAFGVFVGDDRDVAKRLKKRNREEQRGQTTMFADFVAEAPRRQEDVRELVATFEDYDDSNIADVVRKEQSWSRLTQSSDYEREKFLADAWCAAFVWLKVPGPLENSAITTSMWRRLATAQDQIAGDVRQEVHRLAASYNFFHWHVAFPQVFSGDHLSAGGDVASDGFDLVLGNPPWDKIQTEETQFFSIRAPEVARLRGVERKRAIADLQSTNPTLYADWMAAKRRDAGILSLLRNSGRLPLTAVGKFNLFAVFAELMRGLISRHGWVGCIVPSGIASDDTTKLFFRDLVDRHSLVSLYDFENRKKLFPAIDSRLKFCLLTVAGSHARARSEASFSFFAHEVSDLKDSDRCFVLGAEDISLINPNTRTCPLFRSSKDAAITRRVYRQVPILHREELPESDPYEPRVFRLLNTTDDSPHFVSHDSAAGVVPVVEAKTIHQFHHRFATYGENSKHRVVVDSEVRRPEFEVTQRFNVSRDYFEERIDPRLRHRKWFVVVRNIARATDERTVIASAIPKGASCEHTPYVETAHGAKGAAFLLAVLNSFVLDYVARQKVGGTQLSNFIIYQLPIVPVPAVESRLKFYVDRVAELTVTSWSLVDFGEELVGVRRPFRWEDERRFLIRCELDAALFLQYGLSRDEVEHVLGTFPIVLRKDMREHGSFKTGATILELYDRMAEAARTSGPFQTLLDPPPGSVDVAHEER